MAHWYEEETELYYFDEQEAYRYESFFPKFLTHVKGEKGGQPLELMDWVRHDLIRPLFGVKRKSDDTRRFRTIYCEVPRKCAKACSLREQIATPTGWRLFGSLKVGDRVFAPDGTPTTVTHVSEIFRGKKCFRLHFENAEPIIASADHDWTVWDRNTGCGQRVVDTQTLFDTRTAGSRGDLRYRVSLPQPLQTPAADLLIDPYVLGLWLGDGTSRAAHITMGQEDVVELRNHLEQRGVLTTSAEHRPGVYRINLINPLTQTYCKRGHLRSDCQTEGRLHNRCIVCERRTETAKRHQDLIPPLDPHYVTIAEQLRHVGVFGNKHIPNDYLWGSQEQRLLLLQGLMDSDGTCAKNSRCTFSSCNETLARQCLQLVTSLGYKASLRSSPAKANNREVGTHWRVAFTGWSDIPAFKLERKAERLRERPMNRVKRRGKGWYETSTRSLVRSITRIEEVPTEETMCIAVDHSSHCFLIGKSLIPTHNTTVAAGIALAVAYLDNEYGSEIYSAAADRDQAAICFEIAQGMVEGNKYLKKMSKLYRRAITIPGKRVSYKVISADAHTKHGFNAHCVIFDELHSQPNRDLWDVLGTSVGARTQPIMLAITTAGFDRNSICYEVHSYAKRVKSGEVKDDTFLPVIYGAELDDDWTDPKIWQKANPSLGISIRTEYLEQQCKKAQEIPAYENTFKRLHLNIWTEQDVRWLPMATWDECGQTIVDPKELEGRECFAGLDLSATQDLTSLVLAFPFEDGSVQLLPFFWIPEENLWKRVRKDKVPYDAWRNQGLLEESPGEVIDYQRIRNKINALHEIYNIREIACDRWNAQSLMTELDECDGFTVIPLSQQMSAMSGPSKELERLLVDKRLHHGNNPILRWCAANVTAKLDANGNIRPDKEKSIERIDGIVASICALSRVIVHTGPSTVYGERGLLTL